MRLRFSLRLAFVVTAVAAIALYMLYVRPTAIAKRFVTAIEQRDLETAKSCFHDQNLWVFDRGFRPTASVDLIYAELLPREWADIWACRRRIIFRVAYHEDTDGRHIEWTQDTDVVAHINGLHAVDFPKRVLLFPQAPRRFPPDQTLLP